MVMNSVLYPVDCGKSFFISLSGSFRVQPTAAMAEAVLKVSIQRHIKPDKRLNLIAALLFIDYVP
jgi:hypothetical protein